MNCPSCGRESSPGAKFCENCGTPLPSVHNFQAPDPQYAQAPPQANGAQPQYGPPPQYESQPYGQQPYGQQPYGQQPYGQPMYPMVQMKNAGIAAILAFLIAGLGHIYLGLITKGIVFMILMVVLWIVGIFTFGIGFIVYIIFWLWQIYDAYNKANQYNAALQQTGRAPW